MVDESMFYLFENNSEVQLVLTHWDRDKMAAISQTTFSSAFSWMKSFESEIRFHLNMLLRV